MPQTNFQKILAICIRPMQRLEEAAQQNATRRFVDNATGLTLTYLGLLVGQRRDGVDDDELFRRYVRARITVNSSDGLGEQMYTISRLVINESGVTFRLLNHGVAAFTMQVENAAVSWPVIELLIKFLRKAADGGVRVLVQWSQSSPATSFRFARLDLSDPVTGLGFRNYAGTAGGRLASALE